MLLETYRSPLEPSEVDIVGFAPKAREPLTAGVRIHWVTRGDEKTAKVLLTSPDELQSGGVNAP